MDKWDEALLSAATTYAKRAVAGRRLSLEEARGLELAFSAFLTTLLGPTAEAGLRALASGEMVMVPLKCPIGISVDARQLCSAGYCIHCTSERLLARPPPPPLMEAET